MMQKMVKCVSLMDFACFDLICIGELYARAFLRKGEQHPVEPVIDSSRLSLFLSES